MDSSAYGRVMLFLCFGLLLPAVNTSPEDYNHFVYKHCANQTFTDTTSSVPPILSSLFQELVLQSSKFKFFETNVGDDQTAILGRFQCRGDISNDECHNCVNSLPKTSNSWCGYSVRARVQLSGCYIHYEADGTETSRLQLFHNTCSESSATSSGFQELRDEAFAALESCVMNGNGFCDMNYESVHVTAQCEGNLGACDCEQCVSALHKLLSMNVGTLILVISIWTIASLAIAII
ncbi:unnamed protein product [Ilex paraguariensis]|uniref:Gnk2-homologous domain-containing protein n=1 Tax=Ilex paraguariensis TaxID=185542 RepID=A0ABC8UQA6_9AQUA